MQENQSFLEDVENMSTIVVRLRQRVTDLEADKKRLIADISNMRFKCHELELALDRTGQRVTGVSDAPVPVLEEFSGQGIISAAYHDVFEKIQAQFRVADQDCAAFNEEMVLIAAHRRDRLEDADMPKVKDDALTIEDGQVEKSVAAWVGRESNNKWKARTITVVAGGEELADSDDDDAVFALKGQLMCSDSDFRRLKLAYDELMARVHFCRNLIERLTEPTNSALFSISASVLSWDKLGDDDVVFELSIRSNSINHTLTALRKYTDFVKFFVDLRALAPGVMNYLYI